MTSRILLLDPLIIAATAGGWDTQQLDMASSAAALALADPAGFPPGVTAAAGSFAARWSRIVTGLAAACQREADGLRTAAGALVAADGRSGSDLLTILAGIRDAR